jgi:enoyl-CoA hydratase
MGSVLYEVNGTIAQLTLERPDAANSVTIEMALEIAAAVDRFTADRTARALVVTGAGKRAFCAGGAIETLPECAAHAEARRAGPLGFAKLEPGKPTIAAVNGHCFGGGLELALWCDVRIAADNATFGALNRSWGVTLIDGGTQRLPRAVGHGNAMWMILGGERIDASRAHQIGLVQEVVSEGRALARALEFANRVAAYPQAGLLADRASVVASHDQPLAEGLQSEFDRGVKVLGDAGVRDLIQAHRDAP